MAGIAGCGDRVAAARAAGAVGPGGAGDFVAGCVSVVDPGGHGGLCGGGYVGGAGEAICGDEQGGGIGQNAVLMGFHAVAAVTWKNVTSSVPPDVVAAIVSAGFFWTEVGLAQEDILMDPVKQVAGHLAATPLASGGVCGAFAAVA